MIIIKRCSWAVIKRLSTVHLAALLVLSCPLLTVAGAATLNGSFSGVVIDSIYYAPAPPGSNFDGTKASGTFSIGPLASDDLVDSGSGFADYFVPATSIALGFVTTATLASFPTDPQAFGEVQLTDNGSSQMLTILPDFTEEHSGATLTLTAAEGALFSNLDPATLHNGPITGVSAGFSYAGFGGLGAGIDVQSLTINGVTVSFVPLSPSWMMMLTGLGALGAAGFARSRRIALKPPVTM